MLFEMRGSFFCGAATSAARVCLSESHRLFRYHLPAIITLDGGAGHCGALAQTRNPIRIADIILTIQTVPSIAGRENAY